jgi:hypothetical protein
MAFVCTCCGRWRIEVNQYDLAARKVRGELGTTWYVLRHEPFVIGQWQTLPQLKAALRQALGPDLADFNET